MASFKNLSVSWSPFPLLSDVAHHQAWCDLKWTNSRFLNGCLSPSRQAQCQEVRKRKELELQILTESIRLWEGDDIKTLGSVLYMSQVLVQSPGSEVPEPSFYYNPLPKWILYTVNIWIKICCKCSCRISAFVFQCNNSVHKPILTYTVRFKALLWVAKKKKQNHQHNWQIKQEMICKFYETETTWPSYPFLKSRAPSWNSLWLWRAK